MKIKICGMKFPENILAIASLDIDFMGFIFYPKSPRFIDKMDKNILEKVPSQIKKVGVFVNEEFNKMIDLCRFYEISTIQLHGEEKPSECKKLKNEGFTLIKAFSIDEDFNFGNVEPYQKVCDYFLFDTKGKEKGGNGIAFSWDQLNHYENAIPFFLSGGIGLNNIEEALKLSKHYNQMIGIDINSKIEEYPGIKSMDLAQKIVKIVRTFQNSIGK